MTATINPGHIRRVVFTMEQFFNAITISHSAARAQVESAVATWLSQQRAGSAYVVYNHAGVFLHENGRLLGSYPLTGNRSDITVWTDGKKIQAIDSAAYLAGHIQKRGTAGLNLPPQSGFLGGLFGGSGAGNRRRRSNNNNNNNNG